MSPSTVVKRVTHRRSDILFEVVEETAGVRGMRRNILWQKSCNYDPLAKAILQSEQDKVARLWTKNGV